MPGSQNTLIAISLIHGSIAHSVAVPFMAWQSKIGTVESAVMITHTIVLVIVMEFLTIII